VNVAFALGYLACGPGALEGTDGGATSFLDAFFFSVQTFATIGYGKLTPRSLPANLLVTLEALVGLLAVALATGLVFARFSRPTARVLFSERAAIAPHDGVLSLVFRMANERRSQIVQAEVSVTVIRDDRTVEGETYRSLYDLALERHHSPFFTLSWTVVHPIDEKSPLRDIASDAGLRSAGAEIMVSLVGIDDALAQTVHARFSYAPDDIVWGGRFADILERRDGLVVMDLDRFHDVEAPTGG
jgi:inward rectifier potassium channel